MKKNRISQQKIEVPKQEISKIFWDHKEELKKSTQLTKRQRKIVQNIMYCRTSEMGGHCSRCDSCQHFEISYNSCRDRHCPKCQSMQKAAWLEARQLDLLPVEYSHCVFTLPHLLNELILCNKKVLLNALFQSVRDTLNTFAADPQYKLQGQLGITSVLHTWDRKMNAHFHLHCIIPAGAYDKENQRWLKAPYKYLFPVKAMSRLFRGKYLEKLKRAWRSGQLEFPGELSQFNQEDSFSSLLLSAYEKEWVVYAKRPFKSPEHVFDYLGRYSHKIAISNYRIISTDNGRVKFRYYDRKTGEAHIVDLSRAQFISRILLHTLPGGFFKIRYYGFLGSARKKENLSNIHRILKKKTLPKQKKTATERILELTGLDITLCPKCKQGKLLKTFEFGGELRPVVQSIWKRAG